MLTESRSPAAPMMRLLSLMLACSLLCGCAVGYLAQAAQGQWRLMRARQPIDRVIAAPNSSAQLQARLILVEDARNFAVSDLALLDNRSYRSYSDLKRPYAVWNVVAAPEFSVQPLQWCFPFTGCVSYRGYFHERDARAFAARLAAHGNDTVVAGVTAYSTLGHFADPVLNTMMRYGDLDLVATIFHELTHQLLYVPGDSEFNESFAMTVEEEGLRRWLQARGRSTELASFLQQRRGEQAMVSVMVAARPELAALYVMPLPIAQLRQRKRQVFDRVSQQILSLESQYGLGNSYDAWIAEGLNNAHLASVATYFGCIPGFQRLLDSNADNLPAFYAAVKKMRHDAGARRRLCRLGITPG